MKFLIFLILIHFVVGAPKPTAKVEVQEEEKLKYEPEKTPVSEEEIEDVDTGLLYDQYLKKVLKILESNDQLRAKMEQASVDDIKNGKISKEINFLPSELRDKLDEIKRDEINRLRRMIQAKNVVDKGGKIKKNSHLRQIASHLDHENPHSFEAADLTNLIKAATTDLEKYDDEREDEFKQMEMEKEIRRQEKMRKLDQQDREKAEAEFKKQLEKEAEQHKTNHPGSKNQLEEVWEHQDGLIDEDFDPRTFFMLHDLNGDGYMDDSELEALFSKDLARAYEGMKDETEKKMRLDEEKRRMRKHVMKEVDKNGDRLISLEEFVNYSRTPEFESPDKNSYQSLDDLLLNHALYTSQELDKYRDGIQKQEDEIRVKLEALKKEAKNLGGLRRDLSEEKRVALQDGKTEDHEKEKIQSQEEQLKIQEQKVQQLHQQLQNQSKEVVDMRRKLKTHEASEKVLEDIMSRLEKMPNGKEKDEEIAKAHKELEHVKKAQAAVEDVPVDNLHDNMIKDEVPPPPAPKITAEPVEHPTDLPTL